MRTSGSPSELESRRFLAVPRVLEGYSPEEVAAFRQQGVPGLAARPASGRPAKLTTTQEKVVRRWLTESPLDHGFATELWTAANLAHLIEQAWGITLPPRYLGTWLRERGFTPQLPCRVARARDAAAMAA